MKKILSVIILTLIMTLLCGCGCDRIPKYYSVDEVPEGAWRDSGLNSVTYVDNIYIAAKQGNTHYYVSDHTGTEQNENCLYREDMTGEHEIEKIYLSGRQCRWINPVGDFVFYVSDAYVGNGSSTHIERYDLIKKQAFQYDFSKLGHDFGHLFVVGEQMYFNSYYYKDTSTWYRLCRADLDGKNIKILKDGPSSLWILGNDDRYIYYEDDDICYALSLNGDEDKELFSMPIDDEWNSALAWNVAVAKTDDNKTCIYAENTYEDFIIIYNVADGTQEIRNLYEIDSHDTDYCYAVDQSTGNEICFIYENVENATSIGKFDADITKTICVADTLESDVFVKTISVVDEFVYYMTKKNISGTYDDYYTHRINPDGSIDEITKDSKE